MYYKKEIIMNKYHTYWLNNKDKFYNTLESFLKKTDQKLDMHETNPASQIFIAFEYWLSKQDDNANISNEEILDIWLDKNKDNDMYFSKGYESIMSYEDALRYAGSNENIVKATCKELGITQKELAERLGVSKPTVERWSQSGDIPEQATIQISLLIENNEMKKELNELKNALTVIAKYSK